MKLILTLFATLISSSVFADSLSCQTSVGGNIFRPNTEILCSLNGAGAVRYEVTVNGSLKWTGALNKTLDYQDFRTNAERVGGLMSEYKVYVVNDKGEKKLGYLKNQTTEQTFDFDLTQVTASCLYSIGGNVFRPNTEVHCSVYGVGANSYEIKVNDVTKWVGNLNSTLDSQDFVAGAQRVGGAAVDYKVFVIEKNGTRTLVSEQAKQY